MRAHALTLSEPLPRLQNVNSQRGHTMWWARQTRILRALAATESRRTSLPRPFVVPVRIWVEVRFPNDRRRDSSNLFPTAKALVDGLVDAGVLRDDKDGFVEGPWLRRVYPNGPQQIRLVLQEISSRDLGKPLVLDEL